MCRSAFVALSNNFFMAKVSNSDRRYAVIQCNSDYALNNDTLYFDKLAHALNKKTGLYFFYFFARKNISTWKKTNISDTQCRRYLKILSKQNSLMHFLIDFVLERNVRKNNYFILKQIYALWDEWCVKNKNRNGFSIITFSRSL